MKLFVNRFVIFVASIVLTACTTIAPPTSVPTPTKQSTPIVSTISPIPSSTPQAAPTGSQNSISPSLLAEWNMGTINDMVWSPDSSMFVVDSSPFNIQAFDIKSLKKIWSVEDNYSYSIVFNPDGTQIVEPDAETGTLYIRSADQGKILYKINADNCYGARFISNNLGNTYFVAYNDTTGLYPVNIIDVGMWNLNQDTCKNIIETHGYLSLFDLNTAGNLIAMGTVLPDEHFIIWDVNKQHEICRTLIKGYFGRFVPDENVLAIASDQKIFFIDASTCQELREVNVSQMFLSGLAFSPDGQLLAISGSSLSWNPPGPPEGMPIQIVETSTGKLVSQISIPLKTAVIGQEIYGHGSLVFSPDDRYLLLALNDNVNYSVKVQLWRLQR